MNFSGRLILGLALFRAALGTASLDAAQPAPRVSAETTQGLIATTTAGKVRGYAEGRVAVFKGIPYGGDTAKRRFRAPVPPEPWSGVLDTLEFRAASPQSEEARPNPDWGVVRETEDCLVLNVWTPALRDGRKRPVFVYFHGGGYNTWSGNSVDGAFLSQRGDAVVVAVNHRLNGFGYLYLPEAGGSEFAEASNAGQLDLVLSLQWVRDNIAEFGGDPGCVTIFGGSGGAGKCGTLMAMPAARGLFHRVWTTGGAAIGGLSRARAISETNAVLKALDLTAGRINELATVPMARLKKAFGGRAWAPVVDGTHLPRSPFHPDASPLSADIPMVLGTCHDEMTSFFDRVPKYANLNWDGLPEALKSTGQFMFEPKPERVIAEYRRLHPDFSAREVLFAAITDSGVWKEIVTVSERRAAQGGPTYVYCLDWPGRGMAVHTIDLPLVMNRPDGSWRINGKAGAESMAALMTDSFVAFARTGSPQTPELPQWPRFNVDRRPTMVFDLPPRVTDDHRGPERELFAASAPPARPSTGKAAPATSSGTRSAVGAKVSERYSALEPVIGVWTAAPDPADEEGLHVEIRIAPAENREGLQLEVSFLKGNQRSAVESGFCVWHPAKKNFVFFTTLPDGRMLEGTVTPVNEQVVSEFTVFDGAGGTQLGRTVMTPLAGNVLALERSAMEAGTWTKSFELRFNRIQ